MTESEVVTLRGGEFLAHRGIYGGVTSLSIPRKVDSSIKLQTALNHATSDHHRSQSL